jgi:hypothetical protein
MKAADVDHLAPRSWRLQPGRKPKRSAGISATPSLNHLKGFNCQIACKCFCHRADRGDIGTWWEQAGGPRGLGIAKLKYLVEVTVTEGEAPPFDLEH